MIFLRSLTQDQERIIQRDFLESNITLGVEGRSKFVDPNDEKISDIEICTFKESEKYEKRTIIYQISYNYVGRSRTVFRSFREFLSFFNDLKVSYPDKILPLFPGKRSGNSVLKRQEIEQRRIMLNDFLKGIQLRFNEDEHFWKFLNVKNDCCQYKAIHPICSDLK
jgi:hypothetical protein